MSYGRDPDAASRGVGAIAARDRAQPRRATWQQRRVLAATRGRDRAMAKVVHGALGIVPGLMLPPTKPKAAAPKVVTTKLADGTIVHDHRGTLSPPKTPGTASRPPSFLNILLQGVKSAVPGAIPPTPSAPPPVQQAPTAPVAAPTPVQPVVSPAPPPTADTAPVSSGGGGGGGAGVMTSAPPPVTLGPSPSMLPDVTVDAGAPAAAPGVDPKYLWIAGGVAAALGAYFLLRKRGPG